MKPWKPNKNQRVLLETTEGLLHEIDNHWSGWMKRQRQKDFNFTVQKASNIIPSAAALYRIVGETEVLAQFLLEKIGKDIRLGRIRVYQRKKG
jgi:hypothetical protein